MRSFGHRLRPAIDRQLPARWSGSASPSSLGRNGSRRKPMPRWIEHLFFGWWRHFLSHINRHSWDWRKPSYYTILRCHFVQFWKTMVMRDRSRGMRDQMFWKRTSRDWKWKLREPPINGGFSSKPCFIAGGQLTWLEHLATCRQLVWKGYNHGSNM